MHYETVLWDLDGTLLNTLTDLTCSANYALAQCGLPAATAAQVRAGTGNGVAELLAACTPGGRDCPKFQAVCDAFVAGNPAEAGAGRDPGRPGGVACRPGPQRLYRRLGN